MPHALPLPAGLFAGMPAPTRLTELATLRLETLSFFLLLFLVSAAVARWVWNALRSDFPRLPRLSYPKAVGLAGLWGLLFLLVLTMISGARELLTPGAWKPDGVTYTLADAPTPTSTPPAAAAGPSEAVRRGKLAELYGALAAYALRHDGRFPPDADDPAVAAEAWRTPHASGMRYRYVAGRTPRDVGKVLAFEPDVFGDGQLAVFADGGQKRLTAAEIEPLLAAGGK